MSLLKKPEELESKKTLKGLIYGQPGVGKTTLALSSPKPVIIDFDRGLTRVMAKYRVPSLQVDSYQQVLDLINSNELDEFQTIVIDTLGKLVDRICDYSQKLNAKYKSASGQMTMQGWGDVKRKFKDLFRLLEAKNKSLIFVAHESEEKDGDTTIKRPDCSGSARKDITKELDFMGYMEMFGSKRTISFYPHGKYYAKNSLHLDEVIQIDELVGDNNFIEKNVFDLATRIEKENQALVVAYKKILSENQEKVDSIENIEQVNEFYNEFSEIEDIWDSRLLVKKMLAKKVKELNIEFDKANKVFVEKQKEAA